MIGGLSGGAELVQVAGHGAISLSSDGSRLRKPTTREEVAFYGALLADPMLQPLRQFTPEYFGASQCGPDSPLPCVIEISNLTFNLQRACAMDIKLGAVRYTPTTPQEKVQYIEKKEGPTSSPKINCSRICGVRHWSRCADSWRLWTAGTELGRNLSRAEMTAVLQQFCTVASSATAPTDVESTNKVPPLPHAEPLLVRSYLADLQGIITSLTNEHSSVLQKYSFISTSLLFHHGLDSDGQLICAHVRLIDFAHTGPRGELFPDSVVKFLDGICNVRDMLAEINSAT